MQCFVKEYCVKGKNNATVLAPQKDYDKPFMHDTHGREFRWVWVPVCLNHWDGWWDGDDTPKRSRPHGYAIQTMKAALPFSTAKINIKVK